MPLLNKDELTSIKLLMVKDLEKTLKIVYEHQYRNILSKIVSHKKRFTKKSLPPNASEDICRYNSLSIGLTGYLANLFDVFGSSAVLNAKKSFEENGAKWGKKLRKKLPYLEDINDIVYVIRNIYINVPDTDYMDISEGGLVWHLKKLAPGGVNEGFTKYNGRFYDIKLSWLNSFINSFAPRHTAILERKSEDDNEIITQIELREDPV